MTWGDDLATKLLGSTTSPLFVRHTVMYERASPVCELINLATLKTILGIGDTSQDVELQRLIDVYSQAVANFCERDLCEAAREVVFVPREFWQPPHVNLPQWPVASVESLDIDGDIKDADTYVINNRQGTLVPLDPAGWRIRQYMLVKYTAGYNPIPVDIQDAMVQMINSARTSGAGAGDVGPIKSQRVEGAVTETFYDPRTASSGGTSESGASDVGRYASTLEYYRSERAFV